jgi:ubiquinone/menaquinone biosynthesis C-methylase UbiE
MPAMSPVEVFLCRNPLWRAVAGKVVLPWSLQGYEPVGEVLEIGAGSGAMAAELLSRSGTVAMTVTDFDPGMVGAATARLARFGDRATARQADATALPFPEGSFDAVLSWIMLHHTVEWEKALAESVRVLRPGGHVVAYDLLSSGPTRRLHRDRSTHRTLRLGELRGVVAELAVDRAVITPGLGGLVVRFLLRKQLRPSGPA